MGWRRAGRPWLLLASAAASLLLPTRTTGQPAAAFGGLDSAGAALGAEGAGRAPLQIGGEEDDVSDLLYDGDDAVAEIDIDQGLGVRAREKRMRGCFNASRRYMESHSSELAGIISSLMDQAGSQRQGPSQMSPEQVESSVVYGMILTCYQSIDGPTMALVESGKDVPKGKIEETFGQIGGPPPRPSRKQYDLLSRVMREQEVRSMQEAGPDAMVYGVSGTLLPPLRRPITKAAYVILVAAAFVGASFWAYRRIMNGARLPRERTEKAYRKVAKAEERLKKKMR